VNEFNELPSSKPRSIIRIAFEAVREPMLLLLLACGSTYRLLDDVQEAIILLIFVRVVIAITLYQKRKTEQAWRRSVICQIPRALVIRQSQCKG
jgi:P-type Ca2+ transporter type 2C